MSQAKRLGVCLKLLVLAMSSGSVRTRQMYRRQYRMVASRLKNEKQLQAG
ncbi:hypothetical protein M5X00_04875 [Paenibacillus alvei]|nr:hypothetical protein [Paenibacillus alvei]MCY9539085.1 hypothetical protein [Paenibacillus alvei]MCY9707990.1 hypothetical protein [Paenibacillus alvei]MCY9734415.1 hypothetical protein [Paenibacillus alvei]MCY9753593.1 hypothetical protein [Paenibacillus alvei]MEC0078741.1 hypothetical protein [Paenibacillus alvei]